MTVVQRPGDAALLAQLRARLPRGEDAAIEMREPGGGESSHARELVSLRWSDGQTQRVLIKYDPPSPVPSPSGLRTGVVYESYVYRHVLPRFEVKAPVCLGHWTDEGSGLTALAVRYLEDSASSVGMPYTEQFARIAEVIGGIQRRVDTDRATVWRSGLNIYTGGVLRCWALRTQAFERRTRAGREWIPSLVSRLPRLIDILQSAPPTLVHGDLYQDNVTVVDGQPWLFDWEEAALAPGELDLATLTHDWHDEVVQAAADAYVRARWPAGAPSDFGARFEAARMFVIFRLLGEAPGWPDRSMRRWRVELLRQSAERIGLA